MQEENMFISPVVKDPSEIPEVSIIDYTFQCLAGHLPRLNERPWVVDVKSGTIVNYSQIEDQSRRVASALSRRGFKQNDVLYFVTYEMAQLYVVQVAVWRLGGAIRGCFQGEVPAEYARQLRETGSSFVLVDDVTAPVLREAISQIDWPVQLLSVGDVTPSGATCFSELLKDDGTLCPETLQVNPREDVIVILNTSGSTGEPKGVMHTHYSMIAAVHSMRTFFEPESSELTLSNNYAVANFRSLLCSLCLGNTMYYIGKFCQKEFFHQLNKYKPTSVMIYPYVATWFARSPELQQNDMTFLKSLTLGGSVLEINTVQLLAERLPGRLILQYGMTECVYIAHTRVKNSQESEIKTITKNGRTYISAGQLLNYVQVKVVGSEGNIVKTGESGEIVMRAPHFMKGYFHQTISATDENGWFKTGDLGFFDTEANIYIQERLSFMFKYLMHYVSPSEIESVLQEHEAVQAAGVVGIPHPDTTNIARSFVVLRPGAIVTCQQLKDHVAARLPTYMHLHGGVTFVDNLPENRGRKLDRTKLKEMAMTLH